MAQPRGVDPPIPRPPPPPLPSSFFFLLLFLFLAAGGGPGAAVVIPDDYDLQELLQPPELLEEPPEQLVVFPSDDVILKCLAKGDPPVQYSWTRDSQPFDPQEQPGVSQPPGLGGGSLVIEASAAGGLQGRYRCMASSPLGTTLSRQSTVIAENTPQWPKEKVTPVEVEEGDPVVLPCDPPKSAVPPKIYWLNSRIVHITQDERVSMGQDGFLYFAHAREGDSHPDYICHAHYLGPRTIIQKEPLDLRVAPSNSVQPRPPQLLVPKGPQPPLIALRGGSLVLECIAEGLPTPWITWRRLGGPLPEGAQLENFNKTLRLRGVQEGDGGHYQCQASNGLGSARHSHHVLVQAAPYWEQKPQSGVFGPGESARLDCGVGGLPPPSISWRINGIPVEDAGGRWGAQLGRGGGSLLLPRLQPNHSLVAQCEAQNPHGHLLANAYVLVLELPVQILSAPQEPLEVLENGTALLPCRAFGTPTPSIEWLTPREEPALLDDRSFVFTNGTLRLGPVGRGDSGSYSCWASNAHSNASARVVLHVRAPTQIGVPPRNITAKKGETVTFRCPVTFDPALAPRGHLEWLWEGKVLRETPDNHRISLSEDSLTLRGVDYGDQGGFVCRATTPLDSAEAEAWLRVVGRPGPVRDLQLLELGEREIRLSWTPGDDHNSPIEKFVVEEEEELWAPGTFVERLTVPGGQPWAPLQLPPHGRFRFRVLATNAYGRGEPSAPSDAITTPPAAPERNPDGVRGEGNETNNLVIDWEPLPPRAWNGRWLQYRVQWRQVGGAGEGAAEDGGGPWREQIVGGPPLVVGDTPTFVPFEIRVQALNEAGKGPQPHSVRGNSGEDLPLVHPENVRVQLENSSSVTVGWSQGGGPQDLRGHLRGFRMLYWWDGWVGDPTPSPPTFPPTHDPPHLPPPPGGQLLVPGEVREALLGGLRPWSRYRLQLAVVNGRGDGPPSPPVAFETPEGVPGPPEELRVQRVNDTTLSLDWGPPPHPNGVLTGFLLHYQRDPSEWEGGSREPPQELWLPPQSRGLLLGRLEPGGSYRLALRGVTEPGQGPPLRRIGRLRPEPVLPVLSRVLVGEVGEDFTVLHWTLAHPQPPRQFEVQYMSKATLEPWRPSGQANSSLGLFRLGGLRPGTPYRVQFVGTNHSGERVVLWESEVHTNGTLLATPLGGFATEGWFIGFVSAAVLLLLLLLILCFVRRSKGGKYSVKDKEDTQVDSEARPMKDETFGEYRSLESDGEEKVSGSSGGVPGGPGGALGSDDSLAGYGGSGDVQFNEDGSFIGQYSGHRGSSGPASPSAPPPLD